ncbi:MAG TPA: quaternary ammonium compound efflux SMR transporter SugE [Azospira sp.]|nr:quaternary ammonium compound efflux SMR transporter SugE [Azospira sp.]HNN09245.1 quaternary ammonium compound efflux SMR transporter SugE [Azospira sp.]HNN45496.1 quaternary ammonium compound efflux SMR transporter SugE [Azospira sp.]
MSQSVAWLVLFVAGVCEIGWAVGLKYTEGFSRLWPSVGTVAAMIASVVLLGLALKALPLGTAYAVWTGIGAVGTAILGIYLFNEPRDALRLACITLIVAGIVGLKLVTPASD